MIAITIESLGLVTLEPSFSTLVATLGFLVRTLHGLMALLLVLLANSCKSG